MARSNSTNLAVPDASMSHIEASDRRSLALNLIISLRPAQWTKNLLVFAALVFAERLFEPRAVLSSVAAFAIFCALSGVVYLVNDIADRRDRPRASAQAAPADRGRHLPVPLAATAAAVIAAVALLRHSPWAGSLGWWPPATSPCRRCTRGR